jgi:exonuclease III
VRYLNDKDKRITVRNVIRSEKPDIICLQETKLDNFNEVLLRQIVGGRYQDKIHVDAQGTAGGILLSWKKSIFALQSQEVYQNSITVELSFKLNSSKIQITGVYGPSTGGNREDFLQQLRMAKLMNRIPWLICGDFNLVLAAEERSTNRLTGVDREFRRLVNELSLIDLPLQGRRFTWSNARENVIFVRLDRFLVSQLWNTTFSAGSQKALANTSSDHCPIMYTCDSQFPMSNTF